MQGLHQLSALAAAVKIVAVLSVTSGELSVLSTDSN